jgi:hypothetical protein
MSSHLGKTGVHGRRACARPAAAIGFEAMQAVRAKAKPIPAISFAAFVRPQQR